MSQLRLHRKPIFVDHKTFQPHFCLEVGIPLELVKGLVDDVGDDAAAQELGRLFGESLLDLMRSESQVAE